jgi:hypothetical protein
MDKTTGRYWQLNCSGSWRCPNPAGCPCGHGWPHCSRSGSPGSRPLRRRGGSVRCCCCCAGVPGRHAWVEAEGEPVEEPHPPGYHHPVMSVPPAVAGH